MGAVFEWGHLRSAESGLLVGDLPLGTILYFPVNGTTYEFLVVYHGNPDSSLYDNSCDGTWCLMKDCYSSQNIHTSNVNKYAETTIHSWLNTTFIGYLPSDVQASIRPAIIPYCVGNTDSTINSGSSGLSAECFLLSGYELGFEGVSTSSGSLVRDGAKLDYFNATTSADSTRIAYYSSSAVWWWLRTPYGLTLFTTGDFCTVTASGGLGSASPYNNSGGVRPAFILSSDFNVSSYLSA